MRRLPGWAPREDRNNVFIDATIRLCTGRIVPVTIVDVSQSGCKVRSLQTLSIGEIVQIEIPSYLPAVASVRWSVLGRAGLLFV